jgi:c-di-GMP-binding flagellar brake protein YcgR
MINRRRHKRYSLTGFADLKYNLGEKKQIIRTLVSDISLAGIGLFLDAPLEENLDVSLTISFISGDGLMKTDVIEGCVVYNKKLEDVHFMGIEFLEEMNPEKQPSLYEHIQNILLRDG